MITYEEYVDAYHNMPVREYQQWFLDHLTGEYRIGDNWYPCIPLSDECVAPFEDYYISVITGNGTWNHLKKDDFREVIV